MSLLGTVEHLAGAMEPRGSATQAEGEAAAWVEAELAALGYAPTRQPFVSDTSPFWPFMLAAGAVLLSLFFFWQPQPVGAGAALVLTGVAFVALVMHLRQRNTLLRWLGPNDDSRNVAARASATAPGKPPILITAHLDAPRAAHGPGRPLRLLMLAGMGVLLALFALGIPSRDLILRQIALVPGVVALVLLVQSILAQRAPFTAGANGNASGVAVALDLARRLQQQPLAHRDVIIAFTGCGEAHSAGAEKWIRANGAELRGAVHLALSHLGGPGDLALIRREQAGAEGDARLAVLGEQAARDGGATVTAREWAGAQGEMSIGARHGLRAIGLMRLDSAGQPAHWRSAGDTASNIDEASLQHAADYAWQLLQAIDSEA
jgi:acetylornithine deacetylase/succinyl-diaminopimelate desuccinylase-like protein